MKLNLKKVFVLKDYEAIDDNAYHGNCNSILKIVAYNGNGVHFFDIINKIKLHYIKDGSDSDTHWYGDNSQYFSYYDVGKRTIITLKVTKRTDNNNDINKNGGFKFEEEASLSVKVAQGAKYFEYDGDSTHIMIITSENYLQKRFLNNINTINGSIFKRYIYQKVVNIVLQVVINHILLWLI